MDGENNGLNPYHLMDDLEGKPTIFSEKTPKYLAFKQSIPSQALSILLSLSV